MPKPIVFESDLKDTNRLGFYGLLLHNAMTIDVQQKG